MLVKVLDEPSNFLNENIVLLGLGWHPLCFPQGLIFLSHWHWARTRCRRLDPGLHHRDRPCQNANHKKICRSLPHVTCVATITINITVMVQQ